MTSVSQLLRDSFALVAAATLFAGCSDDLPFSSESESTMPAQFATVPDLGACQNLQAAGKLVFHAYAEGVQIYLWNGSSWVFDAPEATLYAEDGSVAGTHSRGPIWESNSGSYVKAALKDRCTPDASSIPWLLLDATTSRGPGIFDRVTLIQRLNTVGGNAPTYPGSVAGQEARVNYTADYFFYRN